MKKSFHNGCNSKINIHKAKDKLTGIAVQQKKCKNIHSLMTEVGQPKQPTEDKPAIGAGYTF